MEKTFWEARWKEGLLGFHQQNINPQLQKYFHRIQTSSSGSRCLVPLCGKTKDMRWISNQGHRVTGVEFAKTAVKSFFSEENLTPQIHKINESVALYVTDSIEIYHSDFFDLPPKMAGAFDWVYDRAAIVALPKAERKRYADQLGYFLNSGGQVLLISFAYNQSEMDGPPFSVPLGEVRELFSAEFDIELLEERDVWTPDHKFKERGLTGMNDLTILMTKK